MKQNLVWMAALGAALSLAPCAAAQEGASAPANGGVQIAVLHAGNPPHEGSGQNRAFTAVGIRAALPISGRWNVWAGAARRTAQGSPVRTLAGDEMEGTNRIEMAP